MTGTVLAGTVNIHDVRSLLSQSFSIDISSIFLLFYDQNIEIVELRDTKKVKSMQMFHRPVASASQGDRVGLCVTQLDHQVVERGLVAAPGLVPTIAACVARVEKIRFFKGRVRTGAKFHFTTGHTTTMGTVHFFCAPALESAMNALSLGSTTKSSIVGSAQMQFDWNNEYLHLDELLSPAELVALLSRADGQLESDENASAASAVGAAPTASAIDPSLAPPQFALIRFDLPLLCPMQSLLIGSKLDTDIRSFLNCDWEKSMQCLDVFYCIQIPTRVDWRSMVVCSLSSTCLTIHRRHQSMPIPAFPCRCIACKCSSASNARAWSIAWSTRAV
jgi:hypothetical protein